MWSALNLLLPVLFPSWRFFQSIEASPRVQWSLDSVGPREVWHDYNPLPERISFWRMLPRLFWNPHWNERLFLVTCAERIREQPTEHSVREIRRRLWAGLGRNGAVPATADTLRFRLVFVQRQGSDLIEEVVFQSDPNA